MVAKKPQYRVMFWFLNDVGWCQVGWAFVVARDRDHALAKCMQRALKLGHIVNADTKIDVREEDGSGTLEPPKMPLPDTG